MVKKILICLIFSAMLLGSLCYSVGAITNDFILTLTSETVNIDVNDCFEFEANNEIASENIEAFVTVSDADGIIIDTDISVSGISMTIVPVEPLREASSYLIKFHDAFHDTTGNLISSQKEFIVKTTFPQEIIVCAEEDGYGPQYEDDSPNDDGRRTTTQVKGYNNGNTRYIDSFAKFIPNLPSGKYNISYWRVFRADIQGTQCSDTLVELYNGSEITPLGTIDLTGMSGGWIDVGEVVFSGSSDEFVKVSKGSTGTFLRVSAMKFQYIDEGSFDFDKVTSADLSDISTNLDMIAEFSATPDINTFDNVYITDQSGNKIGVNASYAGDTRVLLQTTESLECSTDYQLIISGVQSISGNTMDGEHYIKFRTKAYSIAGPKYSAGDDKIDVTAKVTCVGKVAMLTMWTDSNHFIKEISADERDSDGSPLCTNIPYSVPGEAYLKSILLHGLGSLRPIGNPELSNTLTLTEAVFNETDGTVDISGKVNELNKDTFLVIAMLKRNEEEITEENLYYFNALKLDTCSFDVSILLPDDIKSGNYHIYIGGTGIASPENYSFYYITDETIEQARNFLNNCTAQNIENIIKESYRELGFDKEMMLFFNEFSQDENKEDIDSAYLKITNTLLGNRPYALVSDAAKLFNESVYINIVKNCTPEKIQAVIEHKGDLIDVYLGKQDDTLPENALVLPDYDRLDNAKVVYTELRKSNFDSVATLKSQLEHAYAIALVDCAVWGEIENILKIYNHKHFNLDLSCYDALSNEQKDQVIRALSTKDLSSLSKLEQNFYYEIENITKEFSDQTSSGSSSSNKGSSFGASSGRGSSGGLSFGTELKEESISAQVIYQESSAKEIENFTDLGNVSWAKDAIMKLAGLGIVSGYENGRFCPENSITREEFVKMLVCALNLADVSADSHFDDVEEDNWSYIYVSSALKAGIITGINENMFGFGRYITRQEMAVMIMRALESLGIDKPELLPLVNFKDAQNIDSFAVHYTEKAYRTGIMIGTGDGFFNPKVQASRAMAAKVVCEVITS